MQKESNFLVRGAIFDMDGTLLDSMPIWEHFASEYLSARGILPPVGLDSAIATFTLGEAAVYLCDTFSLPETAEVIEAGLFATADALYDRVLPKPGVPELLSLLAEAGVPMAVATMTDRPTVERTLGRLGLLSHFSHIFTCTEVGARKDTPVIYEAAREALGTRREETLVFEDAWYAIKTAAEADFPVAAVYDGSRECRWESARRVAAIPVRDFRAVPWERYLAQKS